jgi:hypothetical protein
MGISEKMDLEEKLRDAKFQEGLSGNMFKSDKIAELKVASRMGRPHKNPNCGFCGGSGKNKRTGLTCTACICSNCKGTGYIFSSGKICEKMSLKK